MDDDFSPGISCPVPLPHFDHIILGHGSGGKLTHELIEKLFLPKLGNPYLLAGDDAALLTVQIDRDKERNFVLSTDSHVVSPLFFPGGDIGRLAVCGTVNDLAMLGACHPYLTAGFILEEGLEISLLNNIISSMQEAAEEAGVCVVAGDTKVVQKGKGDGIFINTSGFGWVDKKLLLSGNNARPGDLVILSGTIGEHGMAVLQARNELGFSSPIMSDIAPLNNLVEAMLGYSHEIHVLRDPTRGGLATTLNEIARQSKVCIHIAEETIPINPEVAAFCDLLGFDPLYVANEGKLIAIAPEENISELIQVMQQTKYGKNAAIIGEVVPSPEGIVILNTSYRSKRIIEPLSGEMLPRIC